MKMWVNYSIAFLFFLFYFFSDFKKPKQSDDIWIQGMGKLWAKSDLLCQWLNVFLTKLLAWAKSNFISLISHYFLTLGSSVKNVDLAWLWKIELLFKSQHFFLFVVTQFLVKALRTRIWQQWLPGPVSPVAYAQLQCGIRTSRMWKILSFKVFKIMLQLHNGERWFNSSCNLQRIFQ